MEYKLIQYRDKDIGQFNREVNELLKDGWKLEGEYRITKVKQSIELSYLVYSQVLTKEDPKGPLGFNMNLIEEGNKKTEKKKKNI